MQKLSLFSWHSKVHFTLSFFLFLTDGMNNIQQLSTRELEQKTSLLVIPVNPLKNLIQHYLDFSKSMNYHVFVWKGVILVINIHNNFHFILFKIPSQSNLTMVVGLLQMMKSFQNSSFTSITLKKIENIARECETSLIFAPSQ